MIEKTIKLYSFDELDESVKTKLYYDFNKSGCEPWVNDCIDDANRTAEKFSYLMGVGININYGSLYIDDYNYYHRSACKAERIETITDPIRLRTYVINNFSHGYEKPARKYNGFTVNGEYHYRGRTSNIKMDRCCPLTGCSLDYCILNPLFDFVDGKTSYNTFDELIEACLSNFIYEVDSEIEYTASRENFDDLIESGCLYDETLFFANGEIYKREIKKC